MRSVKYEQQRSEESSFNLGFAVGHIFGQIEQQTQSYATALACPASELTDRLAELLRHKRSGAGHKVPDVQHAPARQRKAVAAVAVDGRAHSRKAPAVKRRKPKWTAERRRKFMATMAAKKAA